MTKRGFGRIGRPLELMEFKRLKRRLGIRSWEAIGIAAAIVAVSRFDGVIPFNAEEIAAMIDYHGDEYRLVNALVGSKILHFDEAAGYSISPVIRKLFHKMRGGKKDRKLDVSPAQWSLLRQQVIERDGRVCRYCKAVVVVVSVDHLTPLSRGGKSILENLGVSCAKCNSSKGSKTEQEFC